MPEKGRIGIWFQQIRGPFLILPLALTLIGVATARWHGYHHWLHSILLLVGVMLAHASVNLFNELSDFHTRIDDFTVRTPFSGGSGMMQSGQTTPQAVRAAAYGTLAAAALIGIYFCLVSGWFILMLMVAGAVVIRFYTSHLAKWLIGEIVSGLTLGTFVVWGVHYALARSLPSDVLFISIPPGLLTSLLLFLNEFPDLEADRKGGRRHLLTQFGRRTCAWIYSFSLATVYGMILAAPFLFKAPRTVLIALLTLPLGALAARIALKYPEDHAKMVSALGMNVGVVILSDLLLAVGYLL